MAQSIQKYSLNNNSNIDIVKKKFKFKKEERTYHYKDKKFGLEDNIT